jgi:hypothetical protein
MGRRLLSSTGGTRLRESNTSEITAVPAALSDSRLVFIIDPMLQIRFFFFSFSQADIR